MIEVEITDSFGRCGAPITLGSKGMMPGKGTAFWRLFFHDRRRRWHTTFGQAYLQDWYSSYKQIMRTSFDLRKVNGRIQRWPLSCYSVLQILVLVIRLATQVSGSLLRG